MTALAEVGYNLNDFHEHTACYDRETNLGLLSATVTRELQPLYDTNRTDSYYGRRRPTERQVETMRNFTQGIHESVTNQIRISDICTPTN